MGVKNGALVKVVRIESDDKDDIALQKELKKLIGETGKVVSIYPFDDYCIEVKFDNVQTKYTHFKETELEITN